MSRRIAVAFFYDEHGIVDDYMVHLLKSMKPFVERTVFVSNGQLTSDSMSAVKAVADEVLIRENIGFDVWAYRDGLEHIGFENLSQYDELILYNHTFYGPIFPFSEMFEKMEAMPLDFWGISMHGRLELNPFTLNGELPAHINSHFIAIRKKMFLSSHFSKYWKEMEKIESYEDSILKHETRFTKYFNELGYKSDAYIKPEDYGSFYPVFIDVAETIANRSPILKRRALFHKSLFHDHNAIDVQSFKFVGRKSAFG
ncbi:rhamnan synthesis F family protein [Pseudochrobactrum sp. AO18b]|uniref:rhamnan synthesis F family protein n=1 Tax=Pseudochrobactrum sp. AO18b TaxID=1201036 RepID=UPI0003B4E783|nr:rhamnan synthesis F family protein [Pseudochrobactrum sp. AO18b]